MRMEPVEKHPGYRMGMCTARKESEQRSDGFRRMPTMPSGHDTLLKFLSAMPRNGTLMNERLKFAYAQITTAPMAFDPIDYRDSRL